MNRDNKIGVAIGIPLIWLAMFLGVAIIALLALSLRWLQWLWLQTGGNPTDLWNMIVVVAIYGGLVLAARFSR